MECAGLIGLYLIQDVDTHLNKFLAIAVGREIFRPDSNTLVELLIRIQSASFHRFEWVFYLLLSSRESTGPSRHSTKSLFNGNMGEDMPGYGAGI